MKMKSVTREEIVVGLPGDVVESIYHTLCWLPEAVVLGLISGAIRERLVCIEAQGHLLVHPSTGEVSYKPAGAPFPQEGDGR